MKETLEKELIKQIGNVDAPGFIKKLDSIGVDEDVELTPKYISIPLKLVNDMEELKKELQVISHVGRTFTPSIVNGRIHIDIASTVSYQKRKSSGSSESYSYRRRLANQFEKQSSIENPEHKPVSIPETLKGTINGIWLTQKGGLLHKAIKPNLLSWVNHTKSSNFNVVLWSNLNEINENEIKELGKNGILVKDHGLCKSSRFYSCFLFFLKKGIRGDNTAFALASDILRMAILELAPIADYFIYVDPNDVALLDLSNNLSKLGESMRSNSLGFSFYVSQIEGRRDVFHLRNDVLIALKHLNPTFFNDYLNAYQIHLERNFRDYFKPRTDGEAQELANKITLQTSDKYFQIYVRTGEVASKFSAHKELWSNVNVERVLDHSRNINNGNTWLPIGNCEEERLKFKNLGLDANHSKVKSSAQDTDKLFIESEAKKFLLFALSASASIASPASWRIAPPVVRGPYAGHDVMCLTFNQVDELLAKEAVSKLNSANFSALLLKAKNGSPCITVDLTRSEPDISAIKSYSPRLS